MDSCFEIARRQKGVMFDKWGDLHLIHRNLTSVIKLPGGLLSPPVKQYIYRFLLTTQGAFKDD